MISLLRCFISIFCISLLLPLGKTYGQFTAWNTNNGAFNVPSNWTNGVPTCSAGSSADIANGGTAIINNAQCVGGTLDLGRSSTPGFLQIQSGGSLSVGFFNINSTGQGSSVIMAPGANLVCSSTIAIGFLPDCTESGTMVINGASVTSGVVQIDGNSLLQVSNGGVLATAHINSIICGGSGPSPAILFDNGIFQATMSGQNLINGPSTVGAGGMTFNNSGFQNYITGPMSGSGPVNVTGGGKLTYPTTQPYSGPTIVQGGAELTVNAGLPNSNVTVLANSILSGIGNIGGTVTSSGIVSPGDPDINQGIGTLTTGSFTSDSNSTLAIQLGCPPDTTHDLLNVIGSAQLGGTLQLSATPGCTPECGVDFPIVTTTQGISVAFSSVSSGGAFPYVLTPTQNQLLLRIPCLDGAVLEPNLFETLRDLAALMGSMGKAIKVFHEQLTPLIDSRIKDIIFNSANTQYGQMTAGFAALRAGIGGFAFQGLSKEPMVEQLSKRESKIVNRKAQTLAYLEQEYSQWSIFAAASGVFSTINSVYDLPKLNSTTGFFIGGANYTVNEYINAGIYSGYQGITARYENGSRLRSNGVKFGVYATAEYPGFLEWFNFDLPQWSSQWINVPLWATQWNDNFFINAIVGGGINFFNLSRTINIQSSFVNRHSRARGYPLGGELDSLLGGGYEFNIGAFRFGINASMQYTYFGLASFNESGAGDLNVRSSRQATSSLMSTLGGNVSYVWKIAPGYGIIPMVGLYWQYEFLNYGQNIGARFANGRGTPFNIYTATGARNNAFAMAGVTAELTSRIGAYAYYTPQFGGGQISSQGVLVGLTYSF